MATVTIITDDITGMPGAQTHRITFQGLQYDIDLTDLGVQDARDALSYVDVILAVARPVVTPVAEPVHAEPKRPATYADRNALIFADYVTPGTAEYQSRARLAVKYDLSEQSITLILGNARHGHFGSNGKLRTYGG